MIILPEFYEPPVEALEALEALKTSPMVYLAGRAGTGKCVTGNTLIASTGGLKQIASLWPKDAPLVPDSWQNIVGQVVLTDNNLDVADKIYFGGLQPTRQITLSNGLQLECSLEHPLRIITPEGIYAWKIAKELMEGDTLCLAHQRDEAYKPVLVKLAPFGPKKFRQSGRNSNLVYPQQMSIELALLMGLLIGDGSYNSGYIEFTYHESETEFLTIIPELFKKLFGFVGGCVVNHTYRPQVKSFRLGSKNICSWFAENDFKHDANGQKYVPRPILESGPEIWKAFLSGLHATDGHIHARNSDFEITLKPERLVREVQQMFMALGIHSKISQKIVKPTPNNGGGIYWRLCLRGAGKNKLPNIFKYCPLKRKVATLREDWGDDWQNTSRFGDYKKLFPRFAKLFKKCGAATGYGLSRQTTQYPSAFNRYYTNVLAFQEKYPTNGSPLPAGHKVVHLDAPEMAELSELKWIYDNVLPLDIVGITETTSEVYDLCVPDSHTFLANGVVSHNSTFIEYLKKKCSNRITARMVVVAPTGIAALNIGAQTIHSFFRIAPHDRPGKYLTCKRESKIARMTLLVIDEISMVRSDLLDLIDEHMRYHTQTNKPFGGIPVLCVGDLFQLPPVITQYEMAEFASRYPNPWFFYANVFKEIILTCFELQTVHRQKDEYFLSLLNDIRLAQNLDKTLPALNAATSPEIPLKFTPMHLTSLNDSADQFNATQLWQISKEARTYKASIGRGFTDSDIKNMQSPPTLELKVGARVMLTSNLPSNLDNQQRLANGNLGWVVELGSNSVLVNFDLGVERWLTPVAWEKITWDWDGDKFSPNSKGRYVQIPLRLGWAVSIHKSQGITLESALVDLGPRAFAAGQAYVALSRCRTLEGLRLSRPIRATDLIPDAAVHQFYNWKFGSDKKVL